jgi:hypothetical protein
MPVCKEFALPNICHPQLAIIDAIKRTRTVAFYSVRTSRVTGLQKYENRQDVTKWLKNRPKNRNFGFHGRARRGVHT